MLAIKNPWKWFPMGVVLSPHVSQKPCSLCFVQTPKVKYINVPKYNLIKTLNTVLTKKKADTFTMLAELEFNSSFDPLLFLGSNCSGCFVSKKNK